MYICIDTRQENFCSSLNSKRRGEDQRMDPTLLKGQGKGQILKINIDKISAYAQKEKETQTTTRQESTPDT